MKLNRDHFKVIAMCRALEVSHSGYYDWLIRPPSLHAQHDEAFSVRLAAHFEANRQVYGTRRLKDCLADGRVPIFPVGIYLLYLRYLSA